MNGYNFYCTDLESSFNNKFVARASYHLSKEDFTKLTDWLDLHNIDYWAANPSFYFKVYDDRFRFILVWS